GAVEADGGVYAKLMAAAGDGGEFDSGGGAGSRGGTGGFRLIRRLLREEAWRRGRVGSPLPGPLPRGAGAVGGGSAAVAAESGRAVIVAAEDAVESFRGAAFGVVHLHQGAVGP